MRAPTVYFDLADTSDPKFDTPIEVMLIALLAFCPLALGAVQAWSEAVFILLALAMAATLTIKLLVRPDVQFVRSWAYLPIALFVLLILFQLIPLPAVMVRIISPHTVHLKTQLLQDLPDAAQRLRWMTLSFYPESTLHDLRLVCALACVFVVVLNCVRRVSQIRRILGAIAVIGGACAVIALVQDAMGTKLIYGWIPMPSLMTARSGPFINHSHFGQFINLSMGAAAGVGLVLIHQHFRRNNYTPTEVWQKLRLPTMRPAWGALAMIVLSIAAMILALSRGAMLSAAIAGTLVGAAMMTRRGVRGRAWIAGAVVFCVLAIVLLDTDTLIRRLTESASQLEGDRLSILRDLVAAWKQFPLFGTGLGTHAVIFPMYDRSNVLLFASHAEDEYAQLMTETGAAGLTLAICFVGIVVSALRRAVRGDMSPASSAAIGLSFGLLAILIHSFSDFGQHIPAVGALTAVTCGLVLNLAQLRWRELGKLAPSLPARGSLIARISALAAVLVIGVAVGRACYTSVIGDESWQVVRRIEKDLRGKQWIADNAEYADIIDAARISADARPGNVLYRYWLNFYRWKSITRVQDEATHEPLFTADGMRYIRMIADELNAGRWLCPTYGQMDLLAGQMEWKFLPDRERHGETLLEEAFILCGPDPIAALTTAQMEASRGQVDQAVTKLRRAAMLDRDLLPSVLDVCLHQLNRPDLDVEIAGNDVAALKSLAASFASRPETESLAHQVNERALDVILARANAADASAEELEQAASELVKREEFERSLPYFRRALNLDYGNTDCRMLLATAFEKLGKNGDAVREAEICLRRRSEMSDALELVARLSGPTTKETDGE